jgi:hypothetical protein
MCEELIKNNDELQSAVSELENELNRMNETKVRIKQKLIILEIKYWIGKSFFFIRIH